MVSGQKSEARTTLNLGATETVKPNNALNIYGFMICWRGGAVGSGTVLQAGKSRVRFPIGSVKFFIDLIPPTLGSTQLLTEMSTRNLSQG
jgi:hypothetical protein